MQYNRCNDESKKILLIYYPFLNDVIEKLNVFMTSQMFCEIVIFLLTNVPDEYRTAVIVKESISVLVSSKLTDDR
jgi:hypothetical protein